MNKINLKISFFVFVFFVVSIFANCAQLGLISPKDNTNFTTPNVTLRWSNINAPGYSVHIWADSGNGKRMLPPVNTTKNSYTIPTNVLKRNTAYYWQVKSVGSFSGKQSSKTVKFTYGWAVSSNNSSSLTGEVVFAIKNIGKTFSVRAFGNKVSLPAGLITSRGSMSTEVKNGRIHLKYDFGKLFDPSKVGILKISGGKDLKFTYDKKALGNFVAAHDCGFNIYTDTPNFDNWSGTSLLTKGGTCLGVVFTVKNFFESMDYNTSNGINILKMKPLDFAKFLVKKEKFCAPDSKNMREFSVKHDKVLHEYMEFNHLDNLNPMNIGGSIGAVFNLGDDRKTLRKFAKDIDKGNPSLLAMFQHKMSKSFNIPIINKKITFNQPDGGHAMLVYRIYEFVNKSVMCIYDPNHLYKVNRPMDSCITYDASKKHGAFHYIAEFYPSFAAKYKSFFHMPNSRLLFSFTGLVGGSWKKINGFINDVVGKVQGFISSNLPKIKIPKIKWPF